MYDVIVVGAGPAGSTMAREAAAGGAKVLLLDKARFPRDKPCGGGVNLRAANLLPFSLEPVTERTISRVRFSLRMHKPFVREYPGVLTYMTQRSRLDALLVEQAVTAGAEFHDGESVRLIEAGNGITVRTPSDTYRGRLVAGADGANGITARQTGVGGHHDVAVAVEADVFAGEPALRAWDATLALDLGGIPGGYGWVFPKADHLNLGVGGWRYLAGGFRSKLSRYAHAHGIPVSQLRNVRGHHLPVRRPGSPPARGPVLLLGDAAGLIDPLSGEGIYAAILSGSAAAQALLAAGAGPQTAALYTREVEERLGPELRDSSRLQDVFNLMPPAYFEILRRSDRLWTWLCRIMRGEETYTTLKRRAGPFGPLIDGTSWLTRHHPLPGRRAGLPMWVE